MSTVASYGSAALAPVERKAMVIDVEEAALAPGDTVLIVYGDRSGGSPGMRAQTFWEEAFAFKVLVDATGSGVFAEVAAPSLAIVNGAPARLVAVAPATVAEGETFAVSVRAEDAWGNACRDYRASSASSSSCRSGRAAGT